MEMEATGNYAWESRREDSISSFSGISNDVIIDIPTEKDNVNVTYSRLNESSPLRNKSLQKLCSNPKTKPTMVVVGGISILAILAISFTTVFSMTGRGSGADRPSVPRAPKALILESTESFHSEPQQEGHLIENPLEQASFKHDSIQQTTKTVGITTDRKQTEPTTTTSVTTQIHKSEKDTVATVKEPASTTAESTIQNQSVRDVPTTETTTPASEGRPTHKPKSLPKDAQEKEPIQLLYQMKLIPPGRINNHMVITQCRDVFDGKTKDFGWKASLTINATISHIDPDKNLFIGYGTNKPAAKKMAAQLALTEVYPGQLKYTYEDTSDIKKYC